MFVFKSDYLDFKVPVLHLVSISLRADVQSANKDKVAQSEDAEEVPRECTFYVGQ